MEQKDYRLAAIMYTDIAGFSRMMETDEAGTLELLRYHNELIGGIVAEHHGTVIKTIGDALLVDFKNTVEAMQSALEIQDKLYVHNKEHADLPLLVRIGVHLGDIYFFENDALGEGINIAARLQSLARPGCICFSGDVYNLVLNKIEFRAEKLGKVSLKNITKEIHAYEITTPNVEFDPNKDKPRPGYKPGSYLDQAEKEAEDAEKEDVLDDRMAHSHAPTSPRPSYGAASPRPKPVQASPGVPPVPALAASQPALPPLAPPVQAEVERSYSPEGSRQILDEIKKAILQDIKTEGRRLTVDEAKARYGSYGVEASEVIASMVEAGLLVRTKPIDDSRARGFVYASNGDGQGFDANEIGRNIEAAVKGIVGEIERSVGQAVERHQGDEYRDRYSRHEERNLRRAERHGRSEALATDKWDRKLEENDAWKTKKEDGASDFEAYRNGVVARARRQRGGLVGHLITYLAVNGGLMYFFQTSAQAYNWPLIVAAGWGIGLVSSFVAALRGSAKAKEALAMPELEGQTLASYKKLNRVRDSMAMHTASTLTVPVLLGIINLSYAGGRDFLWFLIPTVFMVLSFISHLGSFGGTRAKLQREILADQGVEGGWRNIFRVGRTRRAMGTAMGDYTSLYEEAERAKEAILREIKGSAYDADMGPSLDAYVGQVKLLAQSANEIERIVGAIPMQDLSKDKAVLEAKASSASSPSMAEEYQRSIEEIDKQEKSYGDLQNQSELIKLRLSSSVNQLKQMRLDVARLKAAGEDGTGGVGELKRRTDELSTYLQDLRKGYDENLQDPFAELAAKEAATAQEAARAKALGDGSKDKA